MSRHRNVRNLVEDDYYDGYDDDDYYDDDYYDEEDKYKAHAPAPKASPIALTKTAKIVTATTKASVASSSTTVSSKANPGVTKAPPGWGKPSSVSVSSAPPGITTPPTGWGKPETTGTSNSKTVTTTNNSSQRPIVKNRSKSPKRGGNTSLITSYIPKTIPDFVRKQKSQLTMVILGHVDAGKSTLMGQVLVSIGQVTKREAAKQTKLSWLLDENESERARGVTMEIGTSTF
jgi:elongation factor 1 alpha-like protein